MRKFLRLALMLTAIFSVIIMLVYRYKYYNLRSMLEIINFFTAAKAKNSKCLPNHSYNNIRPEIVYSINHWTEIFDGVYIYSLHVLSRTVISLAYSNDVSLSELESIQCNLWFGDGTNTSQSNIDIHILSVKRNSFLYYIECKNTYNYSSPNAVTFLKNSSSITLPVFHREEYTGSIAACVSPLPQFLSDADLISEFLTYHTHLGTKHYILYYSTFSKAVEELLISISRECDIIIELLPWVVPPKFEFHRTKLKPFLFDCVFHVLSLGHSDFVLSLDLNNFLVLEEGVDLQKFIHDNSPFDFFQLGKKMFCTEYPNNLIAEELNIKFKTLLKTKMLNFENESVNAIYNIKNILPPFNFEKLLSVKTKQSKKKIKSSASIFSYSNCSKYSKSLSNITYIENKKMWLLKQIFFDSCIYKQWEIVLHDNTK